MKCQKMLCLGMALLSPSLLAAPPMILDSGRISIEAPGYTPIPAPQKAMSYPFLRPPGLVLVDSSGCSFVAISAFPAILSPGKNLRESIRERVEIFCPSSNWLSDGTVKIGDRSWAYSEMTTQSLSGDMQTALLTTFHKGSLLSVAMSTPESQFGKMAETFKRIASSLKIAD